MGINVLIVSIPTTKAQVETTDTSSVVVDDYNLLVVRPELNVVLGTNVIGVTLEGY